MENTTLVSIIMPTYNRANLIGTAINSILKQTYKNWELYIVDDASTDETFKVISDYSNIDDRIKYLSNKKNMGTSEAKNKGILHSKGEYIAFLDSDDEWLEDHLFECITALEKHKLSVCFALWIEKNNQGDVYKILESASERETLNRAIKELNLNVFDNEIIFPSPSFYQFTILNTLYCYHINTMVFKRNILKNINIFNTKLRASEDIDFILRVIHDYDFCLVKNFHYIYNQGDDNLHNFMDRRNTDLEMLLSNPSLIKKLTFCCINKCKELKMRRNYIKKSKSLDKKFLCIIECNKRLEMKYFTLGFINKKLNKTKSFYFLSKSLFYGYSSMKIKVLVNILFPFLYRNLNVSINDLLLS